MAEKRISQVQRKTNETDIALSLNLDGNGKQNLSLIHISEPTRLRQLSRMPSSA